jgi:dihydrodiol dehydrogenase / D-xylose 1-dehydrogenase (NADP)
LPPFLIQLVFSFFRQELCLKAGKHTLLEKPFACTTDEAEYLIQLARKKNLFLMEGMWTRFFPAVEKARQLAFGTTGEKDEGGVIGQVVAVFSDFNFNASDSETYPTSFVYNRKLGGGASLLTGPYPIAAATLFYPGMQPDHVKVVGQVDSATGVDLQACISLSFPPTSDRSPAMDEMNVEEATPKLPGAGVASLSYGLLCESVEETTVVGTKGRLTIKSPAHCPTKLIVSLKGDGRGASASEKVYEYPIPEDTDAIKKAGGYFYPNSAGFAYEAAAVARCIAAGKMEAPQYTLAETLVAMKILEQTRLQLGVKAVYED